MTTERERINASTAAADPIDQTFLCDADLPVEVGKDCPHCGATPDELCRKVWGKKDEG